MKKIIWQWIRKNIFKVDAGEMIPEWGFILQCLFFPILSIRYYPKSDPRWEPWNDRFIIFGKEYSGDIFQHFTSYNDRCFHLKEINRKVPLKEMNNKVPLLILYTFTNCEGCPLNKNAKRG